jgi:hypothetical protein
MPLNVADLPLLLAGPILRRVESDLVSVWIAKSRAFNVSLLLFDDGDIVGSSNPLALGTLWNASNLKPAGRVLADLRSPRLLHQEEVPPKGAQIVRRWQSARAVDGSLHFWVGRSKTPRRTDIAPAIRFDVVRLEVAALPSYSSY